MGGVVHGRTTDMVTLLYADATLALNASPLTSISPDGGTVVVDLGTPIGDPRNAIEAGDLIMFSNPIGNAIQEVTAVSSQTVVFGPGGAMNLNQPAAGAGSITQLQDAPGSYPPTTATRVWLITYYLEDATDSGWQEFAAAYRALIARRFTEDRKPFDELASRARETDVWLGCSCPTVKNPDVRRCHTFLALEFLRERYPDLDIVWP